MNVSAVAHSLTHPARARVGRLPGTSSDRPDPAVRVLQPRAVLLPPLALLGLSGGVAVAFEVAHAAVAGRDAAPLAAALLPVVLLPLLHGLYIVLRRLGAGVASVALLTAAAGLTLLGALVQPGDAPHVAAPALGAALCLAGFPLALRWRHRLLEPVPRTVGLLAPTAWAAHHAWERLRSVPGLEVGCVLLPDPGPAAPTILGDVALATGHDDPRLGREVVVSCPRRNARVGALVSLLVGRGHEIASESAVLRAAEGRVDADAINPLGVLMDVRRFGRAGALRRACDLVVSALLLVVLAPVGLAVAVAILLDSGRPVFFRQERVGRRGRLFHVLKFRTMRPDAERTTGPVYAVHGDPRITRVGGFLRRTRLDELPQLVNVLRGEMTLVGPRPERPHFFAELRRDVPLFDLRTCLKPGITGWAQVHLPYAANPDESRAKLEYDLYYVLHRTAWLDLAILGQTFLVALSGAGAR